MAAKGSALKGALAAAPRGGRVTSLPVGKPPAPTAGLQRLSPGVYRNQQGNLVNSSGGALPGQRPQQRPPVAMPTQGTGSQVLITPTPQQQPTFRPPAPLPQDGQAMFYTGGTPNFNELTGMYNQPAYSYPGQDYWKYMMQSSVPQQGIQQAASQATPQQPQQQGIVAPQNPMYKGNIY